MSIMDLHAKLFYDKTLPSSALIMFRECLPITILYLLILDYVTHPLHRKLSLYKHIYLAG